MYAVGIDVSKRKSMVAAARFDSKIIGKPFEVPHTKSGMQGLLQYVQSLGDNVRVIMEHTGRYYEPVAEWLARAGLFVSSVNPQLIYRFGNNSLRQVKTDRADAKKISVYGIQNWYQLHPHTNMDTLRTQLRVLCRQYAFCTKQKTACKNNLIALADEIYPGVDKLFTSPERADGSQKWVDYFSTFWHVDYVCNMTLSVFTERYQKWCKRHNYNFQPEKPAELLAQAKELIPVLPADKMTRNILKQSIAQLRALAQSAAEFRKQMDELAQQLPEYPAVIEMKGVGKTLAPQLIAEIGDVTRFNTRGGLTAYAGVDPGRNDSGDVTHNSNKTTKAGSPHLRRILFQIVECLLKTSPADDRVYQFMMKKRDEGKPYLVYMTAGENKFLRIYYGTVRAYLERLKTQSKS